MFIKIDKLKFKYDNSKELTLDNVSFNAEKGEIISIFGESGSGKSTILRLIAGLETPDKGKIKIDDKVIVDKDIFLSPEKRNIGMVFQDYALFPHLNVSENIKFGIKSKDRKFIKNRVNETLELIEMTKYKNKYPYELSGGQQQRIAIGRAIAPKPKLMLLDEPFSNLDSHLKCNIRKELKKIFTKENMTVIFVSHDIDDCKYLADKVVILNSGKVENILRSNKFEIENCFYKVI